MCSLISTSRKFICHLGSQSHQKHPAVWIYWADVQNITIYITLALNKRHAQRSPIPKIFITQITVLISSWLVISNQNIWRISPLLNIKLLKFHCPSYAAAIMTLVGDHAWHAVSFSTVTAVFQNGTKLPLFPLPAKQGATSSLVTHIA